MIALKSRNHPISKSLNHQMIRLFLAIILGNALGYAAWSGAWTFVPQLWLVVGSQISFVMRVGLIALTFMLFAAPPVLLGALSAVIARRAHIVVGLASGLWSVGLITLTPANFPIRMPVWYAPTVLIFLSGALGGWLMELHAQTKPISPPSQG